MDIEPDVESIESMREAVRLLGEHARGGVLPDGRTFRDLVGDHDEHARRAHHWWSRIGLSAWFAWRMAKAGGAQNLLDLWSLLPHAYPDESSGYLPGEVEAGLLADRLLEPW